VPKAQPKLLEIGKAEVIKHGSTQPARVVLVGLGGLCQMAEQTAVLLEAQGISAAVINPRWIKPLDTGTLEFFSRSAEVVCTFEDHVLHNGFGCAVIELLNDSGIKTPVVRVGWPDQFIEHGCRGYPPQKARPHRRGRVEKILPLLKTKKTGASEERGVMKAAFR